jgi:hypothetical protein
MNRPRFKIGDHVVDDHGRQKRIRKVEAVYLYQVKGQRYDDCYNEFQLRKPRKRAPTAVPSKMKRNPS